MSIIDKQGRILGKINVIDLLVICFLIFIISIGVFGVVVYQKSSQPVPTPLGIVYPMRYGCSNCGHETRIEIPKGEPIPVNISKYLVDDTLTNAKKGDDIICEVCGNKVMLNLEPPPTLIDFDETLSYQEQYYKYLLEER